MQPARFPCGEKEKTRCLLPVGELASAGFGYAGNLHPTLAGRLR